MKTFAYSEIYLEQAADNLGVMLDCAVNHFKFDPDEFMKKFIESGNARDFSYGFSRVIRGMSGRELCNDVYYKTIGNELENYQYENDVLNRTREYWAGWILAKYQWYSCQSFETILNCIKMSDIIEMYHPLHEATEEKTYLLLDGMLLRKGVMLYNKLDDNYNVITLKTYEKPYELNDNANFVKMNNRNLELEI